MRAPSTRSTSSSRYATGRAVPFSPLLAALGPLTRIDDVVQFALAVTEGSLYLLDTDKDYAIVRQIPVKAIASVQLSTLPDNFMAVKLSDGSLGADLLLLSSRKTEIVTILGDAFRDTEKRDLEIKLGNSIDFFLGEGGARQVRFERSSTNEEDEGVKYFIAKPGKGEKITFDCVEDAKTA